MVVGITHGKQVAGKNPGEKQSSPDGGDISRQNSSRTDVIVMRFIEGPKKGQQL